MRKSYFILLIGFTSFKGFAQTTNATTQPKAEKEWEITPYGFVRTDYGVDTRKFLSTREGQLNLYPLDKAPDVDGRDANAVTQSNILAITSRVGVKVKGPNVWGAKMSATMEGDFYGNFEIGSTTVPTTTITTNTTTNTTTSTTANTTVPGSSAIGLFRLRHAYINMDWSKTGLTMGQTWYPTFIPEVSPGVANFNTGIMFNPYGWATQVKLKQALYKGISASFTVYKEREYVALGNSNVQNAASINSLLPSMNGQLQYKGKNVFLGAGFEYKSMQPLTVSTTINRVTKEKVNSSSIFGYAKYSNDKVIIKAYGITGGNLNNLVMLGGFTATTNSLGIQSYDATKTTSFWVDIASNGKSIAPGVFFGTTKNNGSDKAAGSLSQIYGRGVTSPRAIDNVWRASARVDFKQNKFRVSPEFEYTGATWGNTDLYGKASTNKTSVNNIRGLISCVYAF